MAQPFVLVLSGYGINCEEETKYSFELVGARADIVHINDLLDGHKSLKDYQILAFPGGFSYGDDTGSGNAFAHRMKNHLWDQLASFIHKDRLIIGICNGFQIMAHLGMLPALRVKYGERQAALTFNKSARYIVRWVDLAVESDSPCLEDIKKISLPIAHGEGKFFTSERALQELRAKRLIAMKYVAGEMCAYQNLEPNPNGSLEDIAGITDPSGRLLGMMPHPERAIESTQLPNWGLLKEKYRREEGGLPKEGPGLKIFENAVRYFE